MCVYECVVCESVHVCVCVLCAAWQPRLEVQPGEECVCMSVFSVSL